MTNNKALERADIIAALRCCQYGKCSECLYRGRDIDCETRLMGDAAALLERWMDGEPGEGESV